MNNANNYPNYIGVEVDTINSLKIKLKYTGDSEKCVIVTEGSLVSIGHSVNNNGVLSYAITMGIVKQIGVEPTRGVYASYSIANPYYLIVDRSNTYASDIVNIYIRDIRDIIVGPMAEGNFAKGEQSGPILPRLTEVNKDMYEGRFFYLTEEYTPEWDTGIRYTPGLVYCVNGAWQTVTTAYNTDSSPLVASVSESEEIDKHPEYELRGDVFMRGTNIINIPAVKANEFTGVTCDVENSDIRFFINGELITYQVHLTGLSLPSDVVPPVPDTPSNVSITYTVDVESYKEAVIKPSYYAGLYIREKTLPRYDSAILCNRVKITNKYYSVYHKITTTGDLVIHYPNVAGITEMDLSGYYLK